MKNAPNSGSQYLHAVSVMPISSAAMNGGAGQWAGGRGENLLDGGAPFYDTYETADGRHISIAPLELKFFAELARLIGLPERFVLRQYDRRLWPEMRQSLTSIISGKTRDEWSALLEGSDACFAPVLSFDEAPQHKHAAARGAFITVSGVVQPAAAPRFDRSKAEPPGPAPVIGQHTSAVLAEAGFNSAEINALLSAGLALQASA